MRLNSHLCKNNVKIKWTGKIQNDQFSSWPFGKFTFFIKSLDRLWTLLICPFFFFFLSTLYQWHICGRRHMKNKKNLWLKCPQPYSSNSCLVTVCSGVCDSALQHSDAAVSLKARLCVNMSSVNNMQDLPLFVLNRQNQFADNSHGSPRHSQHTSGLFKGQQPQHNETWVYERTADVSILILGLWLTGFIISRFYYYFYKY